MGGTLNYGTLSSYKNKIHRPDTDQACEICKATRLLYIFDGRIRRCQYGPRGHWTWLCQACHFIWGIGFDDENLIAYQRSIGRYREIRLERRMDKETIEKILNQYTASTPSDGIIAKLLGELVLQQLETNRLLQIQNGRLQRANPLPVTMSTVEDKGVNQDDNSM